MTPDILAPMDTYLERILSGEEYVCEWVVLAVKRHFADIEKSADPAYPFFFDRDAAARSVRFAHRLKHSRGDIPGEPVRLHPWAMFFFASITGWKRKDTKARRFRRVFAFLPRGNCKSEILSILALYICFAERHIGGKIGGQADGFCLAVKTKQARLVFEVAGEMINLSPDLRDDLGIEVGAHAIRQRASNSKFEPISSKAKSGDGLNVAFGVLDELHEIPRKLAEVVVTGLGKRASSLLVAISSAGFDNSSYCHVQWKYAEQVLLGNVQDDLVWAIIFTAPTGADLWDEKTWIACNPMWNQSVRPELLRQEAEQSQYDPGEAASFLVKHVNCWQNASNPWMDMSRWDACGDSTLKREDFAGRPAIVGIDLAVRRDLCAKVLVFPSVDDQDRRIYHVFADHYLHREGPFGALDSAANASFTGWAQMHDERGHGFLTATAGETTEIRYILSDLQKDAEQFQIQEVCFDRHYANVLAQDMEEAGFTAVEIAQTVAMLSPAMKEVEAAIYEKRLFHDNDPVLRYCVSNVVARRDANDNVFPRKESETQHIDGASALFDAFVRAPLSEGAFSSYTAERGFLSA